MALVNLILSLIMEVCNVFLNNLNIFLAPLAKGQRAIVMALCPSCVCLFVRQSVGACVHAS